LLSADIVLYPPVVAKMRQRFSPRLQPVGHRNLAHSNRPIYLAELGYRFHGFV